MRTATPQSQPDSKGTSKDRSTIQPRAGKTTSQKTADVASMAPQTESRGARSARRPVRFALARPGATSVCVAGSFNNWQPATKLNRGADGEWVVDVDLPPGSHEYRFVVDGQWIEDPRASAHSNNPYGGRNSVVNV